MVAERCFRLWFICISALVSSRVSILECSRYEEPLMATQDGDIIIGGLFPVHESVNLKPSDNGEPSERECTRYNVGRMLQTLMLIEAVETINHSPLLGNLTLGYRILDSCSDVTTALTVTQRFLDVYNSPCPQEEWNRRGWNSSNMSSRPVDALVGGYGSEISIAVARQLSIRHIPQISYGSTTGILSDKSHFPSFMRTVPEDTCQTQAIVDILDEHSWSWVGMVTTDGDYGRYAAQRFQEHAQRRGVCTAFTVVLPDLLEGPELMAAVRSVVRHLEDDQRVGAVVSFAKPDHMMHIVRELTPNATGRVWIAGDSWSTASDRVLGGTRLSDVGVVLGVTFKSVRGTSHFERYLEGLNPDHDAHQRNTILQEYLRSQGGNVTQPQLGEMLKRRMQPYATLSVGLAVKAVAQAVANLCCNRDCRGGKHFEPWELKQALRTANFEFDGTAYSFDEHGDILHSGYDLVLWKDGQDGVDMRDIVAEYNTSSRQLTFVGDGREKLFRVTGNIVSRCSESCPAGYRRVVERGKPMCCYECTKCPNNTFSNETDADECVKCGMDQWSNKGSHTCTDKTVLFFSWSEPLAIVLLSFAALAMILTLLVLLVIVDHWNTPVVKASVRPISVLLLLSLLGKFSSAVLFVGRPSDAQCQARQVLFGLSFTLCASCVLAKSLKIILAFQLGPVMKLVLVKLYQPYLIVVAAVSVQVAICTTWLLVGPPYASRVARSDREIILQCDEGHFLFFGLMLGYVGLIGLLCFLIAFKGRKLPDNYNEAKFISFSMLIYLICWAVFGPVYGAQSHGGGGSNVLLPGVEMTVILISSYAVLCCHFIPKCYVILFRSKCNTQEVFSRKLWEFVRRKAEAPEGQSSRGSSSSGSESSSVSTGDDDDDNSDRPKGFHNVSRSGSLTSTLSGSEAETHGSITVPTTDEHVWPSGFHGLSRSSSLSSTESGVFILPLTPDSMTPPPPLDSQLTIISLSP